MRVEAVFRGIRVAPDQVVAILVVVSLDADDNGVGRVTRQAGRHAVVAIRVCLGRHQDLRVRIVSGGP